MNGGEIKAGTRHNDSNGVSSDTSVSEGAGGDHSYFGVVNDNKTEGLSLVDEYRLHYDTQKYHTQAEEKEDDGEEGPKLLKKSEAFYDVNVPLSRNDEIVSKRDEHDQITAKKKKKKKKKRALFICTSYCKYDVVRQVATRFGLKEVNEDDSWNLFWTDLSVSVERVKDMKRYQKINHFPGMTEICRKDLLARNLNRMLKLFPKDYNVFPKTWCLPADFGEACAYARTRKHRTYICKPETGCQGKGIFLTKHLKDIKPFEKMICQVYIPKPFLIDGYKFDLRIYVLITSCDPLRIFVYNEGLVRFATSRYREPAANNTSNVFMHLTNYAVNKHSRTYVHDDEGGGSKRKISTFNKWMLKHSYNIQELWSSIDDVIIKTVIAAHPMLKHNYRACFPSHDSDFACFELLGFDILLDHKLKPYVLEVNHSPSYHTDAKIDRELKEALLMDTFQILNLSLTDKKKILQEDRKKVKERLLQGITNHKETENDASSKIESDKLRSMINWEDKNIGNYRRVYPTSFTERYSKFFNQNQSSLFQETAASRAREECARQQREEMESKAKLEALKRPGAKPKDHEKVRAESPGGRDYISKPKLLIGKKKSQILGGCSQVKKTVKSKRSCILNSFEPGNIEESEEKERVTSLGQRIFLIKSYGIIQQIYDAMQKNGTLRAVDEMKYGPGKSNVVHDFSPVVANKLPSMFSNNSKEIKANPFGN